MHIKSTYTLNIFIAYHPSDLEKFEELYRYLDRLDKKNKGYIVNKFWYDGSDLSLEGQLMLKELTAAADLILLLLSEVSIVSPYFSGKTLRDTIQLHRSEQAIVVPIILNTCWWEDTAYKELEVLPRAGLPIYDSTDVKNELFGQVAHELEIRLEKIRVKKLEQEETFKAQLAEADEKFEGWEQHPESLRQALPLYREALRNWREGFYPTKEVLEAKIDVCVREIDFRHYAKAAHEAYKMGDYQTTYFNCKDALNLRNDAVMRKLFQEVEAYLKNEEMKVLRKPFDAHLQKAQNFFLNLQWQDAEKEFHVALEFYEEGFLPKREVIEHKIEICRREFIMETSMEKAMEVYAVQRYAESVEILMQAIREVNRDAYHHIEHLIKIVGFLENASRFHDKAVNRWGFYDTKSNTVIIAPKYLAAFDFSENLAAVKKWDKWGFIDIEGNEIIPFEYDFAGHFKNGIVEVVQGNKTLYINHKGEPVDAKDAQRLLSIKNTHLPTRLHSPGNDKRR